MKDLRFYFTNGFISFNRMLPSVNLSNKGTSIILKGPHPKLLCNSLEQCLKLETDGNISSGGRVQIHPNSFTLPITVLFDDLI